MQYVQHRFDGTRSTSANMHARVEIYRISDQPMQARKKKHEKSSTRGVVDSRPNHAYVFVIRIDETRPDDGFDRSWPPHVPDGLVEAGEHDEEQDEHGDAPGRAALGGGAPVAGTPAALAGVEAEEVAVEGVDGGDPADEEHERDGHDQQRPAELLRRLLDEVLVGEEPRDAQEERDHEQDQDHRVRQRRQRERLHDRRLRPPVAVVRHGRRWFGVRGRGSCGDSCFGGEVGRGK